MTPFGKPVVPDVYIIVNGAVKSITSAKRTSFSDREWMSSNVYCFGKASRFSSSNDRSPNKIFAFDFSNWYRSEERRVGKECRSVWWAYHYRKKQDTNVDRSTD